jgi:hypothetical protein
MGINKYDDIKNMMLCSLLEVSRRFGGTSWVHDQSLSAVEENNKQEAECCTYSSTLKKAIRTSETSINFCRLLGVIYY